MLDNIFHGFSNGLCTLFFVVIFFFLFIYNQNIAFSQLPQDSFSAGGIISSDVSSSNPLLVTQQQQQKQPSILPNSSSSFVSGSSSSSNGGYPSSNLNGKWVLNVSNGHVTNFNATLKLTSKGKASNIHVNSNSNNKYNNNKNLHSKTIEINNFHDKNKYFQIYPNGVAFIVGSTTIKSNTGSNSSSNSGKTFLENVRTTLIIDKLFKFHIILDSTASHNLFNGEPIQGVTTSFINSDGIQILKKSTAIAAIGAANNVEPRQGNNAAANSGPFGPSNTFLSPKSSTSKSSSSLSTSSLSSLPNQGNAVNPSSPSYNGGFGNENIGGVGRGNSGSSGSSSGSNNNPYESSSPSPSQNQNNNLPSLSLQQQQPFQSSPNIQQPSPPSNPQSSLSSNPAGADQSHPID